MMKIKHFAAVILTIGLTVAAPQILMAANEPEGKGTEGSPYLIQSRDELIDLAFRKHDKDLSKHYVLTVDIDLSGVRWTPIGNETIPFSGVFDGNGYAVTGLSVSSGSSDTGLFGYNRGVIKKLMVTGTVSGNENTGILVGFNTGGIYQCCVLGSVSGTGYSVGSMAGQSSGTIFECSAGNGSVESTNAYAGGLVGLVSAGWVENSYSMANVKISGRNPIAGGLIGVLSGGGVRYSYAAGKVSPASGSVRGLIGRIETGAITVANYYDSDATGCSDTSGSPLTTSQSKTASSYKGWNFGNTWDFYSSINNGYPHLRNNPFQFQSAESGKAALPVASPSAGNVAYGTKVTLSSPTNGAVIYYTTNGRTPSASGTKYTQPITVTESITIKALTAAPGYSNSDVAEFAYRVASTPKADAPVTNIAPGTVPYGTVVTLSSNIRGAAVFYTTNGKTPTVSDIKYTEPITITSSVTIKAIAVASGYTDSDAAEFTYRLRGDQYPYTMAITLQIGNMEYIKNGGKAYFDVAPYIEPTSNRTMVPIRFIAEGLGATVYWDNNTKTDYITLYDKTLSIVLNQPLPDNMGSSMLIKDRLFVPIRYVSEQLGARVDWDAGSRTVSIYK